MNKIFNKKSHSHFDFENKLIKIPRSKRSTRVSNQLLDIKYLPDSKRSQGHVEIIISFLIFIGAVLFIFSFLNPISQPKEKVSAMNHVKNAILQNISSDFGKLSVITDINDECYDFNPADYPPYHYFEVQDAQQKYTIFFSDIFLTNNAPRKLGGCDEDKYTLGLYSEEKIAVYEKIFDLKKRYSSYDLLKKELGLEDDFSFSLRYLDGREIPEISVSKEISSGTIRESEDIPIRVINSSADIKELILNIRAW